MTGLFRSRPKADQAVEKIRVFAQPLRLMILSCLLEGERTVSEIEQATGIGQPTLSQQLAELRRASLVQTRRVVKQVHYRLADDNARACVQTIEAVFGADQPELLVQAAIRPASDSTALARRSGAAAFATVALD